jgi:hypothetical protein
MGKGAVRMIDQRLAERFWPNEDPIGAEIGNEGDGWATVVGVAGDVRDTDLAAEPKGMIYIPGYAGTTLVVRTKSSPTTFVAAIREAINQTDRSVAIYDVNTLEGLLAASLQKRKFAAMLLTVFAGLAIALASVGLYAVLRYLVTRRTREIAIRTAIGAQRNLVLRLILRYGFLAPGWESYQRPQNQSGKASSQAALVHMFPPSASILRSVASPFCRMLVHTDSVSRN